MYPFVHLTNRILNSYRGLCIVLTTGERAMNNTISCLQGIHSQMAQRTTNTQLQYGDKCFDVGRMLRKGIKGISTLKIDGGRGGRGSVSKASWKWGCPKGGQVYESQGTHGGCTSVAILCVSIFMKKSKQAMPTAGWFHILPRLTLEPQRLALF